MTILALGLVLAAAVRHATWNFGAKRANGAFIGARALKEGDPRRRLWAAGAIAVGRVAWSLGE